MTRLLSTAETTNTKTDGVVFKLVPAGLCLVLSFFIVVSFPPLPNHAGLVIIFLPVIYILFSALNPEAFKWFVSELLESPSYNKRLRLEDNECPANATSIKPGDFIRIATSQDTLRTQESEHSRNTWSPEILKQYRLVIARLPYPDTGRIELCLLGYDRPYDPEIGGDTDKFFRRQRMPLPPVPANEGNWSEVVANALVDLIGQLSEDQYVQEEYLAMKLNSESGYGFSSIRVALRIARSGGLVTRKRSPRFALELLKVFRSRVTVRGHVSCQLYLTASGARWKNAAPGKQIIDNVGGVMNNYINSNVSHQTVIGDQNDVRNITANPTWGDIEIPDVEVLASELSQLRDELQRRVVYPEQYSAIAEIMSAMQAAQKGDGAEAISKLGRLSSLAGDIAKWVWETANAIGTPLVVALLEKLLHLPSGG
jgi:hypothetical protein